MQSLFWTNVSSNLYICRNNSLGLCQCENDKWKSIKELGSSVMSPYDDRYIDVKFIGEVSGYVTITIVEGMPSPLCLLLFWNCLLDIDLHFCGVYADFQRWRLVCLAFGFVLLLLAPIVSNWVPFYYSSSMAIGVFLVIIILLFQVLNFHFGIFLYQWKYMTFFSFLGKWCQTSCYSYQCYFFFITIKKITLMSLMANLHMF